MLKTFCKTFSEYKIHQRLANVICVLAKTSVHRPDGSPPPDLDIEIKQA